MNSIALQSREDGSEGGEVLQDAALLGADKEMTRGFSIKESPGICWDSPTAEPQPRAEAGGEQDGRLSYPSHFDPPLHHFSPLLRLQGPVSETRGDDTVGHAIELQDRGTDGGRQVLFALFVSLGPDAAQAVVRHHFLKELLEDKRDGHGSLWGPWKGNRPGGEDGWEETGLCPEQQVAGRQSTIDLAVE